MLYGHVGAAKIARNKSRTSNRPIADLRHTELARHPPFGSWPHAPCQPCQARSYAEPIELTRGDRPVRSGNGRLRVPSLQAVGRERRDARLLDDDWLFLCPAEIEVPRSLHHA